MENASPRNAIVETRTASGQPGLKMGYNRREDGENVAITWQSHGENVAITRQEHGDNVARTLQYHVDIVAIA